MTRLRLLSLAAAVAAVVFALAGCSPRETAVVRGLRTQTLHVGLSAEPQRLDPHRQVNTEDMMVALALFEGLTAIDERTSQPIPAAAEAWDVSADGLLWTFHLRPGLRWSDDTPLTSEDFAWSLRRALSPALASSYASVLYVIRGAEAFNGGKLDDEGEVGLATPDPLTLEITLARPTPHLAAILALPIAFPVPRHVIEKLAGDDAEDRWTRPGQLVGNGPFVLKAWRANQELVTVRNPRFHEPAKLESLVFHPYDNAATQEMAFRTGLLHVTSTVPVAKIAHYRENEPATLRTDPYLETSFLRFNTRRAPLQDARVRRALSLAIDREALVKFVTRAGQPPATALTPPGTGGYVSPAEASLDLAEARRLLMQAGFPEGRGLPALEVQYFTDDLNRRVLESIQEMWKRDLGVTVSLAAKEKGVWLTDERQLNYQVSHARWGGDYVDPSTFLELFLSTGGNNATGWTHADYDRLVVAAASEGDPAQRRAQYGEAETILLRESPIAPLFHGTLSYLIHPAVRGWDAALLGFHRYQHVSLVADGAQSAGNTR